LKSILANIVSNSIKYADLEKTNPKIDIEIYSDRNKAEIMISDNGIGIEKEMQSKIFNMFYRANATEPGTGLGLYIAKETIEVLNGTIKIDSTLGDGTTCIINLVSLDKA
jgi:signal transduction histidine kinase